LVTDVVANVSSEDKESSDNGDEAGARYKRDALPIDGRKHWYSSRVFADVPALAGTSSSER
jgi:hypothetical protein